MINKFNIRVYGLLIKDQKILVASEKIEEWEVLKFPGGGLEFGEGTVDALYREFTEELQLKLEQHQHLYTTDFFIESAFRPNEQVISIYYEVFSCQSPGSMKHEQLNSFGSISRSEFLWKDLNESLVDELSFDSDKRAMRELLLNIKD